MDKGRTKKKKNKTKTKMGKKQGRLIKDPRGKKKSEREIQLSWKGSSLTGGTEGKM